MLLNVASITHAIIFDCVWAKAFQARWLKSMGFYLEMDGRSRV